MTNNFKLLKRKIFIFAILITLIAILIGWVIQYIFIDGVFQAPFAEWFVNLCENMFHLGNRQAQSIYHYLFTNLKPIWLTIGLLIILFIVFYKSLTYFTKYLDEVVKGVDKLLDDSIPEIELSSEIEFVEKKLNSVKRALEKRSYDAREAESRKNDLVVYLAHDIRTPLTSIIGYLSLLSEASEMPTDQRNKYINITLEKANRLQMLIDEFFEITRFNIQEIILYKDKINLNHMLTQMAEEFYPTVEERKIKIQINVEEDIYINADGDKLARVFNNILKNAIYYSFDETIITIQSYINEGFLFIDFLNTGKVIPKDKLSIIFEKFYRLDSSRSTNTGGAGLGLAISKEIVNAHGGNIYVKSDDLSTVFTVTLPL